MVHRMLDDVERNVDRTDSKLNSAMRKMKKFIRDTEGISETVLRYRRRADAWIHSDTKSGWCITILIIVLVILLLAVILV